MSKLSTNRGVPAVNYKGDTFHLMQMATYVCQQINLLKRKSILFEVHVQITNLSERNQSF